MRHDRSCAYDGALTDRHTFENDYVKAEPCVIAYSNRRRGNMIPILICYKVSAWKIDKLLLLICNSIQVRDGM